MRTKKIILYLIAVILILIGLYVSKNKTDSTVTHVNTTPKTRAQVIAEHTTILPTPPEPEKKCENGKKATILEGKCTGQWDSVRFDEAMQFSKCAYKYGPVITCPRGTKAAGYGEACNTTYDARDFSKMSDLKECQAKFGDQPQVINYRLVCCEI